MIKAHVKLLVTILLAGASAHGQVAIKLKPEVTVAAGAPITLAQIADVTGPDSALVKDATITTAPGAGSSATIELARVRTALNSVPNLNWGRVTLSGGKCAVRAEAAKPATPAGGPKAEQPEAVELGPVDTIRSLVARRSSDQFGVAVEEIRLRLSTNGSSDSSWIDAPISAGVRCEIVQISAPSGSRMALRIDQYAGDRLVFSKPLMVDILVRRTIVSATVRVEREQTITPDQLAITEEWLSPTAPFVTDLSQVVGSTPCKRLEPGKPIAASDLQSPLVVQRGESIWVDVLSGSAVVRAKAKAMAPGRDGELVQFQLEGTRKTFTARMSGRGRAVMEVDPTLAEGSTFKTSDGESKPARKLPVPKMSPSAPRRNFK